MGLCRIATRDSFHAARFQCLDCQLTKGVTMEGLDLTFWEFIGILAGSVLLYVFVGVMFSM